MHIKQYLCQQPEHAHVAHPGERPNQEGNHTCWGTGADIADKRPIPDFIHGLVVAGKEPNDPNGPNKETWKLSTARNATLIGERLDLARRRTTRPWRRPPAQQVTPKPTHDYRITDKEVWSIELADCSPPRFRGRWAEPLPSEARGGGGRRQMRR